MKAEKSRRADCRDKKGNIGDRGHVPRALPSQKRAYGKNVREYTQLSYTFQKRGRTDYVQSEDLERV